MATLVLTVAGGAIGGPIGAAIGGLIGQSIDRQVLRPRTREGPRLADLSVQTSTYGTAIPLVFGTMRVAGCVIWSTDLIETRTTGRGGKGQPSTSQYSYAASFAVLLSGRPIGGVGRIWADGTLLRGAAGDFKVPTGFRLHLGDADQPADPLIASVEGAAQTPAQRGCAYAVFENLQLADYGNRIPSLTFELIADPGPVSIGAIIAAVAAGIVADDGVAATLDGFSAYGDTARGIVALLAPAGDVRIVPRGGVLALTDHAAADAMIDDAGIVAAGEHGTARRRRIAAVETVPRTVAVAHYDAARDYQIGVQRAVRPGAGTRDEKVDMPAVMSAAAAKTLAAAMLMRAEAARQRRTVGLAGDAAAVAPGMLVALAGEQGIWRVTEASLEAMVTKLELTLAAGPGQALPATPGRALPAPDLVTGETILVAAELPALDDDVLSAPRVMVAAAGTSPGWRRAALLYSIDDGASWHDGGVTAAPARPPDRGPATLFDKAAVIEVALAHPGMTLHDADDAALDRGANLALVGEELIQFGRATMTGGGTWRLDRLLRGRRGTEASAAHLVGERFALLDAGMCAVIGLPVAALGASLRVLATGPGDVTGPVEAIVPIAGRSVRPPSPCHVRPTAGGVAWVRRSRAGFRWIDGGDAPLAEEAETYRVTIVTAPGETRTVVVARAEVALDPAEAVPGTSIEIRQIGMLGESPPAIVRL
ncbi:phage tail protein [uncultured Sphingomonas sp.]|uniref:GTA baseplate fiber-binding domain-containing protein n=1 Tax=uncultured Sphingomonas sp. TaxID=158754 RepID=UPI0035CA8AC0